MAEGVGFRSAWDCQSVKEALKERDSNDVCVGPCHICGNYSYYNEGSHFSCSWCDWSVSGSSLDAMVEAGEFVSLDEYTDMLEQNEDIP